eukprot:snap_masked-scaffold_1-processed-gene-23.60-mRNA-1 protein AED:0.18 eAED:0.18 QI:0/-1/0/1/-1/1/1/0/307
MEENFEAFEYEGNLGLLRFDQVIAEDKNEKTSPLTERKAGEEKILHSPIKTQKSPISSTGNTQLDELLDTQFPPRYVISGNVSVDSEDEMEFEDRQDDDEWYESKLKELTETENIASNSLDAEQEAEKKAAFNFPIIKVLKEYPTREDVLALSKKLDAVLEYRQAKMNGVCIVREDIFNDLFDELLRQIFIKEPERGILLSRVQNEARLRVDAYKMLYESAINYGIKKLILSEQGLEDLSTRVQELEEKVKLKSEEVRELKFKISIAERTEVERQEEATKLREKEISYLTNQHQNYDKFLKSCSGED